MSRRIAVVSDAPDFQDAVRAGGGTVVSIDEAPEGVVWLGDGGVAGLREALQAAPEATWVQLPAAGIERLVEADVLDPARTWTCAKGIYGELTAEHALALALAGLRRIPDRARASTWQRDGGSQSLYDARVVILGAGGISAALLTMLAPFRTTTTVVRRDATTAMRGADQTVGMDHLTDVLPGAAVVVLALALTPETTRVIDAEQLAAMDATAWLVNVARGRHVGTDALVTALRNNAIGGAALDVTDPEPLTADHPLWQLPNCLITPHVANPSQISTPLLAQRVTDNVRRFIEDQPLLGLVDLSAGY